MVERSDIVVQVIVFFSCKLFTVVQVVDARNPLLFRTQDLEDYVTSVDPAKKNLILVNKADLLLSQQRDAWAAYFEEIGVDVVFWFELLVLSLSFELTSGPLLKMKNSRPRHLRVAATCQNERTYCLPSEQKLDMWKSAASRSLSVLLDIQTLARAPPSISSSERRK